eukprot:11219832-Lingulodinium_polyedra.AAC.1
MITSHSRWSGRSGGNRLHPQPCHEPRERGTHCSRPHATSRLHPSPCHMRRTGPRRPPPGVVSVSRI